MFERSTADKVQEIRRWHVQDRGWRDVGYHLLIDRNGTVANGRPLEQVGSHTKGHNTGTVGICLIGGHGSDANDKFAENFTPAQDAALQKVIADLIRRYPSITRVAGHNQFAAKACPGFNVPGWYAAARAAHVNKTAKS
jgi:N-acetyl-anhydromuramyl-L-alanine amidase AmpD